MGYRLSIPDHEYDNGGLADALRNITRDCPRLAEVNHLRVGYNNDDELNTYMVLGVVTIQGLDFVALRPQDPDDYSRHFDADDNFFLVGINAIMSVDFKETQ